jgi:hypothetical protein
VRHKSDLPAALHQAPEGPGVAVVVLGGVPSAVAVARAVAQVAHIIVRDSGVVLAAEGAGDAALAEVLGGGADAVAAVRPDPPVADQEGQRVHPAGGGVDAPVTRVFPCNSQVESFHVVPPTNLLPLR